nr:hypothetical protein [uncultured Lichenicoccus sp.]
MAAQSGATSPVGIRGGDDAMAAGKQRRQFHRLAASVAGGALPRGEATHMHGDGNVQHRAQACYHRLSGIGAVVQQQHHVIDAGAMLAVQRAQAACDVIRLVAYRDGNDERRRLLGHVPELLCAGGGAVTGGSSRGCVPADHGSVSDPRLARCSL